MVGSYIHNTAPRSLAELVVHRVVDNGELLSIALREVAGTAESSSARAQVVALSTGTVRWLLSIDAIIADRYKGKFKKMRSVARNALRIALFQLIFTPDVPPSAVINHATGSVRKRLSRNETNIVNALLRGISRELKEIELEEGQTFDITDLLPNATLAQRYSHPEWLVANWQQQFGEDVCVKLLQAHQEQPAFGVRPNTLSFPSEYVIKTLEGQSAQLRSSICKDIVLTDKLGTLLESEAYTGGEFSVQDPAAGLVVQLLQPEPGSSVLDVCAAPGGKAIAAAQYMENIGSIIACDISPARLKRVNESVQRLHATCVNTSVADGTQPFDTQYDIVMLDAPCSGTGTISRKPDVKLNKTPETIDELVALQRQLLTNAAGAVRLGGQLLFSTCSIENQENQENVAWFLNSFPEFTLVDPSGRVPENAISDQCLQVLPGQFECDGAFAALFQKK